jgi:MoxR-like ATPase
MQNPPDINILNEEITRESAFIEALLAETSRTIIGQQSMIERLLIGLLTKGHILLEGLPGLAKTLAIKTLAQAIDVKFARVQFTPDLLPADVIGTMVYSPAKSDFFIKKGPIFANFVLADEINRAPAKVQSALLEAMQERQVTIGDTSFPLDEPFLVLATQNPIEQEGTYPLPEAQMDRFLLKIKIGYPSKEEERMIIRQNLSLTPPVIRPVIPAEALTRARIALDKVYIGEKIEQYIIDLVFASRQPASYGLKHLAPLISYGGSPRASIALAQAARAMAFLHRRGYVIPEDVRSIAPDVLRHRIGLTYEAEAQGLDQEEIILQLLKTIKVP